MLQDDKIEISTEANEDDTRITVTLVSLTGEKITLERLVMELEEWLNDVDVADSFRKTSGAVNH